MTRKAEASQKKIMSLLDKHFWKFEKETHHLGGSTPFWDWTFSANLKATKDGKTLYLTACDLFGLKKILKDFDGRSGTWKTKKVEVAEVE